MGIVKKSETHFTYSDYKDWEDSEKWELINGEAYMMSPSPTIRHQTIANNINRKIGNYLENKSCIVLYETDVVLSEENVVKPDIIVVCDKEKITEKYIKGAPEFVAEILSVSTARRDKIEKLKLYKKFGVKEYWIVDPVYSEITIHYFEKDEKETYYLDEKTEGNKIYVKIFGEELALDIPDIFKE